MGAIGLGAESLRLELCPPGQRRHSRIRVAAEHEAEHTPPTIDYIAGGHVRITRQRDAFARCAKIRKPFEATAADGTNESYR